MFQINGENWSIYAVPPSHPTLYRSDGSLSVASCDDNEKTIYIFASDSNFIDILNKKSGLVGISGLSSDMRDLHEAEKNGNERAKLAIRLFTRRIADYIGQYFVRLGGADLIIFSAGIGENSTSSREDICKEIAPALGVDVDYELNAKIRGEEALISTPKSKIKVVIIPTDEEVMIARDTFAFYK
mgnify:CR=1 FL=1